MPPRTKEFRAFDAMMGDLLTVPKTALNERMAEHRAKVDANPKRRGPKRKASTTRPSAPSDPSGTGDRNDVS
jgi:hypothetical protein